MDIRDAGSEKLPIRQAAAGDEGAFLTVMQRMMPLIRAQVSCFDTAAAEQEDLTQECLLGLLSAVRTYRDDGGATFTTYACACIRNRLISVIRRSSARAQCERVLEEGEELPGEGADPAVRMMEREDTERLYERLRQRLTPLEYQVLLARLCGSSYADIAEYLGVGRKSVDNAVQRLRRKLANP